MRVARPEASGRYKLLRIPMRGYETVVADFTPDQVTRYESPCGVMSNAGKAMLAISRSLRIPMRGYELMSFLVITSLSGVTNPHAGL